MNKSLALLAGIIGGVLIAAAIIGVARDWRRVSGGGALSVLATASHRSDKRNAGMEVVP